MRTIGIFFFLSVLSIRASGQVDTLTQLEAPSNAFANSFATKFPGLKYSFDEVRQVHNYSGNWDFDGDGNADDLFFIGNGGAHVYFHLRMKLTSENTIRDYEYILSDFPFLETFDDLRGRSGQFQGLLVVHDFNGDGVMDLLIRNNGYIRTDGVYEVPKALKAKDVLSPDIVFCLERKKLVIKDRRVFQ